ncbi:uncharacterized protein LOC124539104 [Vanessa cardui]|uniref:uncharacterized protein LOC124539104 n=1 Tax=Vanessa cardui TaxID=171605 RepID=UPI001F135517|nr:uncharacterized protein LOC124539104 [Vanessa cardui]
MMYVAEILNVSTLIYKMFAPAFAADLLSNEIYKIKVILHDELLADEGLLCRPRGSSTPPPLSSDFFRISPIFGRKFGIVRSMALYGAPIWAEVYRFRVEARNCGDRPGSAEVGWIKALAQQALMAGGPGFFSDESKKRDLNRFINYIEVRPFKFNVIKIITLDATFPVVVLNLCITYLIISLQLTHLY